MAQNEFDVAIIGGGFYGCALALFLRSVAERIVVIEREDDLLTHASRVNQARVHTGFHYPRSFVTALRSLRLRDRFARQFEAAVVDDFQMLYAIAQRRSKVSASRFERMFVDMGAPIERASASQAALFDPKLIERVFACSEYAFDWRALRDALARRMEAEGITLLAGRTAQSVGTHGGRAQIELSQGDTVSADAVFNVTYSGLNTLLANSGLPLLALKHELAEIALVEPPAELDGLGVTVMDGPFFSIMPYPSQDAYSLTHVRYTPHASWTDGPAGARDAYALTGQERVSRWRHMMLDARRYMPCCGDLQWRESLFDTKTVLLRNERNDGRPILLHRHSQEPSFFSVLGGKIDNIFDMFDLLPQLDARFAGADERFLSGW